MLENIDKVSFNTKYRVGDRLRCIIDNISWMGKGE